MPGHILDLAPTAYALLGLDVPSQMHGTALLSSKLAADAVH